MQIAHFQSYISQIIGKILRRSLGQCCHQNSLVLFYALATELNCLVYLIPERFKGNSWIEKSCGTNDLLDDQGRARGVHIEFFWRFISS